MDMKRYYPYPIPDDMWGHMLDNIYSLGFTEGTPPPLGHFPSPPPPPILYLPQHQIHHQPFFPSPHTDTGRGPGPPPPYSSHHRPFAAVADPSPRGVDPSSRTAARVGAPPPDAGPSLVVHPPPALLSPPPDLPAPQAVMDIVTRNYTIFRSLVHRRR
jgi:hypothetical protein